MQTGVYGKDTLESSLPWEWWGCSVDLLMVRDSPGLAELLK